jgi:YjbE family integral membrane protein
MDILTPLFWTALLKIIGVNIILSGDNAVVIALAARSLPPAQQKRAIFWGSAAAIVMRIVLTMFAVALLQFAWLKIVGSVLLLWIGVKLLADGDDDEGGIKSHSSMFDAIKTILIADLVMSLDNVIAVAAAAKGDWLLVIIGLAISIPLIIYASTILIKVMEKYPVVITIGAALIGWVAGEMAWDEQVIKPFTSQFPHWFEYLAAAVGATLVVGTGKYLSGRQAAETPQA